MNQQIIFKRGEFQVLAATRDFALGNHDIKVLKGTELEFDGQVVNYDGNSYPFPSLRAAVSALWLVPVADYDEEDPSYGQRVSAGIKVGSATQSVQNGGQKTTTTVAEADERIVMNTNAHARSTQEGNVQRRQPQQRQASVAGDQDGVVVGTVRTPTHQRTELTASSAGSALRQASDVKITPGRGITPDEMMARMTDEEREQYLIKKESVRHTPPAPKPKTENGHQVVGRVKSANNTKVSAEGMTATVSTARGSTGVADSGYGDIVGKVGSASADEHSVVEEDGMRFANTNGPRSGSRVSKAGEQRIRRTAEAVAPVKKEDPKIFGGDVRRTIAKALCQDFPDNYDFEATARKKLARLQADYEDRPDVIRAVFAAEGDAFKETLLQEFPEAFAG